jgi:hypothetical protein
MRDSLGLEMYMQEQWRSSEADKVYFEVVAFNEQKHLVLVYAFRRIDRRGCADCEETFSNCPEASSRKN